MAIHPGGARLFSSIPFKHLAQVGQGGDGAVNVALNVTPFVDMMTILVSFLLMVFSSSGELIAAENGLTIPNATQTATLKVAPIIIVSQEAIKFADKVMATPAEIMAGGSMDPRIAPLYDRLRQEMADFVAPDGTYSKMSDTEKGFCERKNKPAVVKSEEICAKGLLIIQADREIPAKVLNKVIKTANMAGYNTIMFAITIRGGGE